LVSNWLHINLGMPVPSATFTLVNPDGSLFDNLSLYDDGAHDDGGANDGLYGGLYNAPAAGSLYIQADGQTPGGETFRRTALSPVRFQEMELITPVPAERFALPGETVVYRYRLWNDSDIDRIFVPQLQSSRGWATTPGLWYWVPAHTSTVISVTVDVPLWAPNAVEQSTLTMLGVGMADSGTVATTVRGWVMSIEMAASPERIGPNGRTSTIMVHVLDDLGWNVADGTVVDLQTDLGTLDPLQGTTVSGLVTAALTSGAATGVATVQATAGALTGQVLVEIAVAPAYTVSLSAASYHLPPDGTSTTALVAYVHDEYGAAAPDGTAVVFAVAGDELNLGSIDGQEVYTATATGGVAVATYRSGTQAGLARVYAGIPLGTPSVKGEGTQRLRWNAITIVLGQPYRVYLPIVFRATP
jgi:hypothetical protein